MKSVGSLLMLAIGVVVALAVTVRTTWFDIPLAGWSVALGGAVGLLIDVLRQKTGARAEQWQVWAPRLLAVGAIGWLALQTPSVPYIDLPTVGFIVFLVGAGLCAGAVYELSGWRLGRSMREMWRTPDDAERTRVMPAAHAGGYHDGAAEGDRDRRDAPRAYPPQYPPRRDARHDDPPTQTMWRP